MEFSRQEYFSGLPFSSPGDLLTQEANPNSRQILYHLSHQGTLQFSKRRDEGEEKNMCVYICICIYMCVCIYMCIYIYIYIHIASLVAQLVKNLPAVQEASLGSIPGLGRSPKEARGWQPTPVSLSGKSHGQRGAWWAQSMGSQRVGHD